MCTAHFDHQEDITLTVKESHYRNNIQKILIQKQKSVYKIK